MWNESSKDMTFSKLCALPARDSNDQTVKRE